MVARRFGTHPQEADRISEMIRNGRFCRRRETRKTDGQQRPQGSDLNFPHVYLLQLTCCSDAIRALGTTSSINTTATSFVPSFIAKHKDTD
jgi:hypothetical protein